MNSSTNPASITVRLATLADTIAITEIHKSDIARWERLTTQGKLIPAQYDDLTLYERWQHGGPWMRVETCAVHLNRLLAGAGIPLVAELDGRVLAEAEVYESFEPAPYGHHLDLSLITTHADYIRQGLGSALVAYIVQMARLMKVERVTVAHAEAGDFYEKHDFKRTRGGRGIRIPSQPGRVFYQSTELIDRSPAQIKGWHMLLGRNQSSRQEWQKLFPEEWAAGVPELLIAGAYHLKLTTAGQTAILYVHEEADSQPGEAKLSCWSARALNNQVIAAIRDWAHRTGYRALMSYIMEDDLGLLSSDIQQIDYVQDFYELVL